MTGPLKRIQFLCYTNNLLSHRINNFVKNNFIRLETIKLSANCKNDTEQNEETEKKKTKSVLPKIKVISPDGSIISAYLQDAAKLAKRRNLFLVRTNDIDPKSSMHIYKLETHGGLIGNTRDCETEEPDKTVKTDLAMKKSKIFTIKSKITKNDLDIKLNKINKLLKKDHSIDIIITDIKERKKQDELANYIKKNIVEGSITNCIAGSDTLRIILSPASEDKDKKTK